MPQWVALPMGFTVLVFAFYAPMIHRIQVSRIAAAQQEAAEQQGRTIPTWRSALHRFGFGIFLVWTIIKFTLFTIVVALKLPLPL